MKYVLSQDHYNMSLKISLCIDPLLPVCISSIEAHFRHEHIHPPNVENNKLPTQTLNLVEDFWLSPTPRYLRLNTKVQIAQPFRAQILEACGEGSIPHLHTSGFWAFLITDDKIGVTVNM